MGFFTIFVPDGLSEADYEVALRSGPTYVSTRRRNHEELLATAGFSEIDEIDLTPQFLEATRGWHDGRERFRDELIAAEGEVLFEERQTDSRVQAEGIKAGVLRRAMFICR